MSTGRNTILFVGGGTGGHMRPGLVLQEELRRRHPDWQFRLFVSGRPVERQFLDSASGCRDEDVLSLFPGDRSRPALWRMDRYLSALSRARTAIRQDPPDLMVLLGGYVSALAMVAAPSVPSVLLVPDQIPGRAARLASRRARRVFAQWPDPRRETGQPRRMVTGMPLAWNNLPEREEARRSLGLDPRARTLVVLGGSQGARSINRRFIESSTDLTDLRDLQVVHVAGSQDCLAVERAYRAAGVQARVWEFCDRMPEIYAAADLLVSRAGGMTVAEVAAAGRVAVFVPYPYHRDRHQEANALELVRPGAAWMVREEEWGPDFVRQEVAARLRQPEDLRRRERIAARLGRREATRRIVEEIESLVWRGGECRQGARDESISSVSAGAG